VVRIDSPTVSRHHARISVSRTAATIEDLQSKNGTYVRNERIHAETALADGDEIQVGDFVLTFRAAPLLPSTETTAGVMREGAR
jgi:pSer/pThr/pTyr-binding forkhead associated (FHA) protein